MSERYLRAWLITPFSPLEPVIPYDFITETDLVIAVDGGLEICRELNLSPRVLIGDMDSLPRGLRTVIPDGCENIIYRSEKNETDTQLAVEYCLEQGIGEIIICNNLEGRFDHALALVQNLMQAQRNGISAKLVSSSQIISVLSGSVRLSYPAGSLLSLLAVTEKAEFAASSGLKYPLDNLTLYNWQSRGISNVATEPEQVLDIVSGLVLVVSTLR
jgi:thiamine pyrophosphokinase